MTFDLPNQIMIVAAVAAFVGTLPDRAREPLRD